MLLAAEIYYDLGKMFMVMKLSDDSILKLSSHVKLKVDSSRKETFLLAPEKAIRLNSSAKEILNLVESSITLSKLRGKLSLKFGDSFVSDDLNEFVSDMISKGWVYIVE